MVMVFGDHFEADLMKGAADAHVVLLARCCYNILRTVPRSPVLVTVAVEEVANLDAPVVGSAGAEELGVAIAGANELLEDHQAKHAKSKAGTRGRRRREPIRASQTASNELAAKLRAFLECVEETPGVFGDIERNMPHMESLFGFAPDECGLLLLSMACGISSQVDSFLDKCLSRTKSLEQVVGACLGLRDSRAREILAATGSLGRSGVVKFDRGHRWFSSAVEHHVILRNALTGFHDTPDELRTALVGSPVSAAFDLDDFPHVRETAERLSRLLEAARKSAVSGVNILLHGRVGVGKTTIAKVIARDLALYSVGESDEDGKEPERDQRVHALLVAQQVLKGQADSAILIDEAEDVLVPYRRGKIFINRLLENNPVPVIYIVNSVSELSDAVKRRMTFILELHSPPAKVREKMVRRVLQDRGVAANDSDVCRIAGFGNVPPGIISNAAQAAVLSGGGIDTIMAGVKGVTNALDGSYREAAPTPDRYDPRFSCANADLPILVERLVSAPRQDWSLLLLGKPGTGKSATARYIAERLGMPVLQVGGPQVMRPHVGETEMALAGYFAQAKAERSFLIFDEIDSLAFNRGNSTRSWEVSHTNTLLELLQDHDLPMACCTNAEASNDRLDPAILRRFTFKITYEYLSREVARNLFRHVFGTDAPRELDQLTVLAPGDFAVVAKKAAILGIHDSLELYAMLEAECAIKGEQRRDIGFHIAEPTKTCRLVA